MLHSRALFMSLPAVSLWFTLLLGVLIAQTPLGTDSYLPALPVIARAFDAPVGGVQLTLTSFFVGLAVGQLIWGPLSDRFGRKPVLLAGTALSFVAAVACMDATSVGEIVWLRLAQGLGMSSGPVVARSIVRDLYTHEQAARLLARMTIVFSIAPIAAPLIGAQLVVLGSWQAVLGFLAVVAALLFVAIARGLPETAPAARSTHRLRIVGNLGAILGEPRFRAPFVAMLCAQAGIFAFISSSAFVLVQGAGVSPGRFSLMFACVMLGQISGAWASSRLVMRFGISGMLRLGTQLACAAGLLAAVLAWSGTTHWLAVVLPFMGYMFASALVTPNATAAALSPFQSIAGAASSLIGASQFALGAVISALLGALFDGTPRAMTAVAALGGVGAVAAEMFLVRSVSAVRTS
jgi:MFS transporter, DHA1 family, multidrug resistance protein